MSGAKKLPALTKLRPPYPDYVELFFTGDDGQVTLNVNDPRHGFRHDAKGFATINAWWLAEACGLVYDNLLAVERRFKAAGMDSVELFDSGDEVDTQCFVASNSDFSVVAFRGTESDHRVGEDFDFEHVFNDVQADSQFKPVAFGGAGGMVHTGFKKSVDAVWPRLAARLSELRSGGRTFWFTGHSLGAALATLAFARSAEIGGLNVGGIYAFGSPLVGDGDFKTYFDGVLRRHGIEYYRFVNNQDIVARVPPERLPETLAPKSFRYGHVGRLKFIDHRGQISDGLGALDRVVNLFGSLGRRASDIFNRGAPSKVRFVPGLVQDHVPMFYATHIWNAHVKE